MIEGADADGITPTLEGDAEAIVEDVPDVEAAGWTGGFPPVPTDGAVTAAQPSATRTNVGNIQRAERR